MDRFLAMRTFVKAVELGSFSAAGDALALSPQLVGKHVRLLEQQLGARLLNRTTRRQSLTDVGRTYFERARNILSDVAAAEDLVSETQLEPTGRLKISAPVSFGIHALCPSLESYAVRYPKVDIDLSLSNRYVDLIDEGFDVVFRVGTLPDSGLMSRRLASYRVVLCASQSYIASHPPIEHPRDLVDHNCLGYPFGSLATQWEFDGPDGRTSVPIKGAAKSDSGEALLVLAKAGLGVLLQSSEMVEPAIARGELVRLLSAFVTPPRPFHLLFAPDRRPTPKLRSFIDHCTEAFG